MNIKHIFLFTLIISVVILSGCTYTDTRSADQKAQDLVSNNQQNLLKNQPIPKVDKSLERENLIERTKLLNDESKVFYVYLISYGKVMAFYTAKTKVSSLNSYLNPQEKIVSMYMGDGYRYTGTIDSPDIDGSYGKNADAVFFFTTDGAYVEWKGEYMASDYPLKLATTPELVRMIE